MAGLDYRRLFTDQQLIKLYEQGFNDREKGDKLWAHIATVGVHRRRLGLKPIRKHGVETSTRRRLFTDQQLIELYEQGLIDREIGEKLGSAQSTVNVHRRKLGLKAHRCVRSRMEIVSS